MPIAVRGIQAMRQVLGKLAAAGRAPNIKIDLGSELEENKVKWLEYGTKRMAARDFGYVNDKVINAMAKAYLTGLIRVKGGGDPMEPWQLMAEAYLQILVQRVQFSGGDVHGQMAKLRPSTIKRKRGSTRLFYNTGNLLSALKGAQITITAR